MNSMKIFLDFDDVVFNTQAFLEKLQNIFMHFGVSRELFFQTYQEMKSDDAIQGFCYSFQEHIQKAEQHVELAGDALLKELEAVMADTSDFLFPDVKNFLEFLRKNDAEIFILSFGDISFQGGKIAGTGIAPFITKNIITNQDKAEALLEEEIKPETNMWFFDDRVHFIKSVKEQFPMMNTVLVQRPEGRFQDVPNEFCDYTIASLQDGREILEKNQANS